MELELIGNGIGLILINIYSKALHTWKVGILWYILKMVGGNMDSYGILPPLLTDSVDSL